MNKKIKEHLKEGFRLLCTDEDFRTLSAFGAVGFILCFFGWMLIHRHFSYGMIAIAAFYGSLIGLLTISEMLRLYGESND